ncbi:ABC transporter ATP-binding protein [Nitratidesulfovibrio sp. HK-II]|uniref:energy-coupling factor ABC transporter ATP-binding protein n=1 Tax=Nitratidesulfovibrio sp. HK-II TaxID=2009266 RepID=UPI000EE1CCC6|nr:ABC transporter ATP-binding protein [Nitratidesulfovibrio sp. HK-II]GBO96442.1 ATPase component NikO of energizing module of nickel ECF transporter [Nitratidesulfovibrio sp. HK-II]
MSTAATPPNHGHPDAHAPGHEHDHEHDHEHADGHEHGHERPHSAPHADDAATLPLAAVEDIHFTYPGSAAPVLRGASLALRPGRRIGLLGHNGSGKSTLLHLLMGLLRPQAGRVLHRGVPLAREADFGPLRREVGFLFQNSDDQLFCPTVLEDVAFGPLNHGASPAEARGVAEATLERLGFAGFGGRVTHRLSGGEKKMIALAAVLAMQPQALLLDEPTNDLDPRTRDRLIAILAAHSPTHLIISHDWDFLAQTCDSFLSVQDGSVRIATHTPHTHVHTHTGGDVHHHHG